MKKSASTGTVRILVRLGASTLLPRRRQDIGLLSKYTSLFAQELIEDLAIPSKAKVSVDTSDSATSLFVSINDEPCRVRRRFGTERLNAKKLAGEIAEILVQNREKLIDQPLVGSIAGSIRDEQRSPLEGIYLAGLSRADFHDYLRLLARRCFRIDRGAHLSGAAADTLNKWSSHDCFEEAVRTPSNLQVVLYRASDSPNEPQDPNDKSIGDALGTMGDVLFYELGLSVPQVALREDRLLRRNELRLQINDVRLPPMQGLGVHESLVNETVERLSLLTIKGRKAVNPVSGNECAIVRNTDEVVEALKKGKYATWGRNEYAALLVGAQLRKFAGSLIVRGTVEYELLQLKNALPDLVEIVEKRFPVNTIVQFLRYLADEEISVRNLSGILEALLTTLTSTEIDFGKNVVLNPYAICVTPVLNSNGNEADSVRTYGEAIRSKFTRYISHKYTQEPRTLVVYLLDPQIESILKETSERSLTEKERLAVLKALESEVGDLPSSAQNPVILTGIETRRAFRDLIAIEFPNMAVLSYQELSPDLIIKPIARIKLNPDPI